MIVAVGDAVIRVAPPQMGRSTATDGIDARDPTVPRAVKELATALAAYLAGEAVELATRPEVDCWLAAADITGFRRDASLALFDVPRGVTLSYGELAALTGRPGAARAAGSACARNPLPLVVPCHRVVHARARPGDVGAYGAGTGSSYKRRLLELEDAPLVRAVGQGAAMPRS